MLFLEVSDITCFAASFISMFLYKKISRRFSVWKELGFVQSDSNEVQWNYFRKNFVKWLSSSSPEVLKRLHILCNVS